MKDARIYEELAALARAGGYPDVTAAAVHGWRKRGMLPSARSIGRARRRPGQRIPAALTSRVRAICHYRYDIGVRDLRMVTVLLWLDGAEIEPDTVRRCLAAIRDLPARFVALVGHPARRADPDATDADIEAAAEAVARYLPLVPGSEPAEAGALANAARDALGVATGRGEPEDMSDLDPLAGALGLARARTELVLGAGPWLEDDPSTALAQALTALFRDGAGRRIDEATDDELRVARDVANGLARVFRIAGEVMRLGYPGGTAGFGLLWASLTEPQTRPLLAYIALLHPSDADALAKAFTPEQLSEWEESLALGRAWLEAHPELAGEVEARGLVAVVTELDGPGRCQERARVARRAERGRAGKLAINHRGQRARLIIRASKDPRGRW